MKGLLRLLLVAGCVWNVGAQTSVQPTASVSPNPIPVGYPSVTITVTAPGTAASYACYSVFVGDFPLRILGGQQTSGGFQIRVDTTEFHAATHTLTVSRTDYTSMPGCYGTGGPTSVSTTLTVQNSQVVPSCNGPIVFQAGVEQQHRFGASGGSLPHTFSSLLVSPSVSNARLSSEGVLTALFPDPGEYQVRFSVRGSGCGEVECTPVTQTCQVTVSSPTRLTDISPRTVTACGYGFNLAGTGTGFTGQQRLQLGSALLPTQFDSSQRLVASLADDVARALPVGTVPVVVTNAGGTPLTSAINLNVRPAPTVSEVTPGTLSTGSTATVDVVGTNFVQNVTRVYWTTSTGRRTLLLVQQFSATRLTVQVPAELRGTAASGTITVLNADESNSQLRDLPTECSARRPFAITAGVSISGITPATATACGPAVALTITGTGFTNASQVQWQGTALSGVEFRNGTELRVTVPAATLGTTGGTIPITVANPGTAGAAGTTSPVFNYTVSPAPQVNSLSVTSAQARTATPVSVRVTGSGFLQNVTRLRWRSQVAQRDLAVTYVSATELGTTIPVELLTEAGTATISAYNQDAANPTGVASTCSTSQTFTVTAVNPALSQLQPSSVVAFSGSTAVVITGTDFAQGATVNFGGSRLEPTSVTATEIRVSLPASELQTAREVQVSVVNPGGVVSATRTFTVSPFVAPQFQLQVQPSASITQQRVAVQLNQPSTTALRGTMELTFVPTASGVPANWENDRLRFTSGSRTLDFEVPQGVTAISLPDNGQFQPGNVAGTVTATVTRLVTASTNQSVLPATRPFTTYTIAAAAPVIETLTPARLVISSESSFSVEVTASSNTRQVTEVVYEFQLDPDVEVEGSTTLTFNVSEDFQRWYTSAQSLANGGSSFTMTQPFTLSGGDARTLIRGVTVRLRNQAGESQPQAAVR